MSKCVQRWGIIEITVNGPSGGNPFTEQEFSGTFTGEKEEKTVRGFYDGDGIYRVRFMPSYDGNYTYSTFGTFPEAKTEGAFTAMPPEEGNHGPVHTEGGHRFAYADGTPYYSLGTTCYVWELQPDDIYEKTLKELDKGYFNKMRFCVMPKHYIHNFRNPVTFPYEGTPCDNSWLNEDTFRYGYIPEDNKWDFSRFNPEHFRRVERAITDLMERGIEADLIMMHPYDRWGFSCMGREADDLYYKYCTARFSAYRNVWWSLANEYDLMQSKTEDDWEHFADMLCRYDPYGRLRGIHQCVKFYDHSRPWVTHCSLQRQDLYRHVEYTDEYIDKWQKPVVWDEIAYEGNIDMGWGNISGQELVRRFWEACMRGGYAGHGETYMDPEHDVLWWSHGGELHGESPERIRFLHEILCRTPGNGLHRTDGAFDEVVAIPDSCAGYEIHYYGFGRPGFRNFFKPEGEKWQAEIIDTWNMTVEDAGVHCGKFRISLPGREWMAVRLKKV